MTLPVSNGQPPVVILPGKAGGSGATIDPAIDIAALSTREAELSSKLDELEAREAGIDRNAQQSAAYATRSEGLMVAFAARRALDRGLNLGFLEPQLRARFGTTQAPAVATVVQAARNPVTLEDLRAGLDGVAPELVTGVASSGWLQSLGRELRNLVVLRKSSAPSPLPVDRVARAQRPPRGRAGRGCARRGIADSRCQPGDALDQRRATLHQRAPCSGCDRERSDPQPRRRSDTARGFSAGHTFGPGCANAQRGVRRRYATGRYERLDLVCVRRADDRSAPSRPAARAPWRR